MSFTLKTIGELPAELLAELLMEYDKYITEFFDDCRHLDDERPVGVHEFYEHEFLGHAEEKAMSWKLYKDTLQYSFEKIDNNHVNIVVGALMFTVEVSEAIYNADHHALTDYIEENHGEMIFDVMNALLESK